MEKSEQTKACFIDRIMAFKLFKPFLPFYKKYREILLYLFFGGLTTIVSFSSYWLFYDAFEIKGYISNIISWVLAVLFAFFTNRIWVFNSPTTGVAAFLTQMAAFFGGRLFSGAAETIFIFIFVDLLSYNSLAMKLIASVFVVILNYFLSKLFIFKNTR